MTGTATHINYISDDGNTYRVLVPSWQATFTGDAAATATVGLPKGYQRRKRMLRDSTTGKEYKITVGDITKAAWTTGFGATPGTEPTIPGHAGATTTYAGRIGERDLIRG